MADFDIELCPHCGKELNYMANTCPECGEDLPLGASYCPNCGEEVDFCCTECGETITKEDVDKYNQLSHEEKAALREAYLQKLSEKKANYEALIKKLKEKRRKDQEQHKISKAQDEAIINEITDCIKSQVSFDCKLSASLTLTFIDIKAKIMRFDVVVSFNIKPQDGIKTLYEEINKAYPDFDIKISPDVDISTTD